MRLREATVQDVDTVVDLVTAMLQEMASLGGHALDEEARARAWLRARFAHSVEKEDHVYVVAVAGRGEEELAGVVEASVVSPEGVFRPKAVVHIHSLYVEPGYRGEGIARRLLEEALDWGRRKGCLEAELNVLANNPARRLYERAGFEVAQLEMRLVL
jgi:ribosomal protein S18 acetylase RimI-like enzyme